MTESDDNLFGGGGGVDLPPAQQAGNLKKTAKPVDQLSETARRNRRRRLQAVSQLDEPELAKAGLLGIPGV